MTVKKRLFLSNILMIFVPVGATALIGMMCVGFMWMALINGIGLGIHDQDEFDVACAAITEGVEDCLKKGDDLSFMETMLDGNGMYVKICSGDNVLYSYGETEPGDEALMRAAGITGSGTTVTRDGRGMHVQDEYINGTEYMVYLLGSYRNTSSYSELKVAVVFSAILIMFTIVVSILMTNRFLTKFVLRRIEEPLDALADAANEIGQGKLEHHIVYDGKDEFQPVCAAFNEMTDRLRASIERTQREEESRKELLAGISHDIRSPLTSIQAYVEGLLDGIAATPEAREQYLRTIKRKAGDIDRLVSQLFWFSKLDMDEYPMELRPLRLDEMVAMMVQESGSEYAQRGLEISVEAEPVTVMADAEQLHRVLTNIMDNSAKYKTASVGHMYINVEKTGNAGLVTLSDDGPGVSEEALPKLFDVFYRSDPARKDPAGGSGLGLAIAAKTIQKMGGGIAASDRDGGGLTITITLNVKEENDAEDTDNRG